MRIVPITLKQACAFVDEHHRHNDPPRGWKFGIGLVNDAGDLIGVATAGRPVAAAFNSSIEINRTCTTGARNANSMLYGAARRAAVAMGYEKVYTYTQADESGASLRAAGFRRDKELKPRKNWAESSVKLRHLRNPEAPSGVPRVRWVWP